MERFFYIVLGASLIAVGVLLMVLTAMSARLREKRVELSISDNKNESLRELRLHEVREKIRLTQLVRKKQLSMDDVRQHVVYQHSIVKELIEEMKLIFPKEYVMVLKEYPLLSELDILVLVMISQGYSNTDICDILQMEKRTFYRRRQLIALRMQMSSTEIEKRAESLFPSFD